LIDRRIVPTERAALVGVFRGMRGSVHVGFEEGTQAQWLHDVLEPLVDRVVVCDRRGERWQGNKGDRVDAEQGSELLRRGGLRPVYHGGREYASLKELARCYETLVKDTTRVMLRLKSIFRARAIRTPGQRVYHPHHRAEWLEQLEDRGVRFRAQALYMQLDLLRQGRSQAKAAMLKEARHHSGWRVVQSIPFFGPVRTALLLAELQTPWRFRTKRSLWAYAGQAVVTRSSADYEIVEGRPVRRRRAPLTRGLNRNHNPTVKHIFKSAAVSAASRPGPLQDFYLAMVERGMRRELALVTLARKLAAVMLRLWKKGERFDPAKLTLQAH